MEFRAACVALRAGTISLFLLSPHIDKQFQHWRAGTPTLFLLGPSPNRLFKTALCCCAQNASKLLSWEVVLICGLRSIFRDWFRKYDTTIKNPQIGFNNRSFSKLLQRQGRYRRSWDKKPEIWRDINLESEKNASKEGIVKNQRVAFNRRLLI